MFKINCSSCSAAVEFRSAASVFAVCSFCRSTLVRHDMDLECIGKMAILKDDFSPIQLSTQGKYLGIHFCVVGRIVRRWESGSWNEWRIILDDAREAWLSEAQGFYSVGIEVSTDSVPGQANIEPGLTIDIAGEQFVINDIKEVTASYGEGELARVLSIGKPYLSVDLSSTEGGFACIEYSEAAPVVFKGSYFKFDELHFQFLREIDGW